MNTSNFYLQPRPLVHATHCWLPLLVDPWNVHKTHAHKHARVQTIDNVVPYFSTNECVFTLIGNESLVTPIPADVMLWWSSVRRKKKKLSKWPIKYKHFQLLPCVAPRSRFLCLCRLKMLLFARSCRETPAHYLVHSVTGQCIVTMEKVMDIFAHFESLKMS